MSFFLKSGQKLQVTTLTTQSIHVVASYVDISSTTTTGSAQFTSINSASIFDVISSPGSDAVRCVKQLSLRNVGSAPQTLTASLSSSTGLYHMYNVMLGPSAGAEWVEGFGWKKVNLKGTEEPSTLWNPNSTSFNTQTFSVVGTNTWTKPTSFTPEYVYVLLWGGGGGGGRGGTYPNGLGANGGAGGGGGAHARALFRASDISSTVQITIGSGGLGGASGGNGSGSQGGTTSFGTYLYAPGGGGGESGIGFDTIAGGNQNGGGGGGGSGETGLTSAYYAGVILGAGGGPGVGSQSVAGGKGADGHIAVNTTGSAEFGGGGGGVSYYPNLAGPGGAGIWGGAGGGAGGARYSGLFVSGSAGGKCGMTLSLGGGGAPAVNGNVSNNLTGSTGGSGSIGTGLFGGSGGGGGGCGDNGGFVGGVGGAGGPRGGGGGGGGAGTSTSNGFGSGRGGNGGAGGRGEAIIICW